jgi:coenzyme F420-0:L-glutamate ligase
MIHIYPVKTGIINVGTNIIDTIIESIPLKLRDKDILVISSKPILIALGYTVKRSQIECDDISRRISKRYNIPPHVVRAILSHSIRLYGGTEGFLLSEVDGILLPNAGIDNKNCKDRDSMVLPPIKLKNMAKRFYTEILNKFGVRVPIIISDSTIFPLRRGTRAVAIYVYGFKPIKNYIGKKDLFGRKIKYTTLSLADEIASAAHLLIGEGEERTPAAVVRGVEIILCEEDLSDQLKIEKDRCLYNEVFESYRTDGQ